VRKISRHDHGAARCTCGTPTLAKRSGALKGGMSASSPWPGARARRGWLAQGEMALDWPMLHAPGIEASMVATQYNRSIDTDPQQQKAAPPLMLVVRSSSRHTAV
jgi:hypothetical protein